MHIFVKGDISAEFIFIYVGQNQMRIYFSMILVYHKHYVI